MPTEAMADRGSGSEPSRRLDSWKEIAAYLGRDVRTVQRWERCEGLPVHRLQHNRLASVFAHTSEVDAWRETRDPASTHGSPSWTTRLSRGLQWAAVLAPAAAVAVAVFGSWLWPWHTVIGAHPQIRSVAVLPFGDLSENRAQAYLAEGMTEAVIARLSVVSDMRVISRTSVMQFKDTRQSVQEIARLLNADAVVEGTVLRSGNRVRISTRLVRASTAESLWSGSYDRDLIDVLALQSEVAAIITARIQAAVTPTERARLTSARRVEPEVYESYLKGRFHLSAGEAGRRADIEKSIEYFKATIAGDPTFAPAHSGRASAYQRLGSTGVGVLPVADATQKATAAARKALELDPDLAEAHTILARAQQQAWRWEEAEAEYRRALARDPNDAAAHLGLGGLLTWRGRTEEGMTHARRARELEPLTTRFTVQLGWLLYHARRYDDAIREFRTVLSAEPDQRPALWFLGFALIEVSRFDEAIQTLERLVDLWDRNPAALGVLVRAYGRAGRRADALRVLDELKQRERAGYVPPAVFVNAYIGVGDHERAFVSLERAYDERSNIVQFLKTHPLYDPIRADVRFAGMLHRVGLE